MKLPKSKPGPAPKPKHLQHHMHSMGWTNDEWASLKRQAAAIDLSPARFVARMLNLTPEA